MRINKSSRRRILVASGGSKGNCPTINCGFTFNSSMRDDYISGKVKLSKGIAKKIFS